MPVLIRDFETRGVLDLPKVGAWRYATDPNTDVLCCAYAVDDGPVELWVRGDAIPREWIEASMDPSWMAVAFNDNFERQIEAHIMAPRYGWPEIPRPQHRCLMGSGLALALPGKLATVALALNLSQKKDTAGNANMMTMAKPRKRREGEPSGVYWHTDPARFERFYAYCKQDGEVERALLSRVGFIPPAEQAVWELDQTINDRGVYIDAELATAAIKIDTAAHALLNAELTDITEGAVTTVDQDIKLKAWLAAHGCPVDDIKKETIRCALTRKDIPAATHRVLELRRDGAHAATGKYAAMLNWRNPDGRARSCFIYHGASTGRWASRGIQLQNMKKTPPGGCSIETISAIKTGDLDHLRILYPDNPLAAVGDVARAALMPAPGHRFIDADFSGIESRVLAWLAGEQSKLDQWIKFDETCDPNDEPYLLNGIRFGLAPEKARDPGKTGDLAFGFAGGKGAYRKFSAPDDPTTDAEVDGYKDAWRRAHPMTAKFWRKIEDAAINAVQNPGKIFKAGAYLSWRLDGDYLLMRLPSGRDLAYPFPSLFTDERGYLKLLHKDNEKGKWVDVTHFKKPGTWSGKLTENAVQAVARDIFAAAMPRLEASGYPVVLHLHDEILSEVPEDSGSLEEFIKIITARPEWAKDLPVAAKGDVRERFCKIKSGVSPALDASADATPAEPVENQELMEDCRSCPAPVASAGETEPREPHAPECRAEDETEDTIESIIDTEQDVDDVEDTIEDVEDNIDNTTKYNHDGYPESSARQKDSYGPHYVYRDRDGQPYSRATRVVKAGKKTFKQSRWEGGTWVFKAPTIKIPYRLPELIASPPAPVFICEGEKDAESVAVLGLVATTNPGGGIAKAWTSDLNKWFVGRIVYILEDNDPTGRAHANEVADALRNISAGIKIAGFPELPEHGDVSDWLEQGHTKDELLTRAKGGRIPGKRYELVSAEDVLPKNIDWLWHGHLAANTLELLAGVPGAGKSQIQDCYVACVTTGIPWPDGAPTGRGGKVSLCSPPRTPSTIRLSRA